MRLVLLCFLLIFAAPVQAEDRVVSTQGEFGRLEGSLRGDPAGPLVLIIPGSGPIDRNGLRQPALGLGVYQKLAIGLAERGVATVRIDKRGSYASSGAIRTTDDLRIAGYANDARRWVDGLRKSYGKDCVWLFGHSEGGLVASVVLRDDEEGVCGLILAASAGREIDEILHDQLTLHTKSKRVLKKINIALQELKSGNEIDDQKLPLVIRGLFNPVNQRYFIDWMTYDPPRVIAGYQGPTLILQGTTDFQVKEKDARRLAAALPQAELQIVEGMNHSFQLTDLLFPPSDLPLAQDVVDLIADFVKAP